MRSHLLVRTLCVVAASAMLITGCGDTKKETATSGTSSSTGSLTLLNVSYDPTRELYEDYNKAFAAYWQTKSQQAVTIKQSHGGSGKQARSVIDGLEADVVTLGIASDINAIQKSGAITSGWSERLPDHSTPYTSTIVLLVRKGNPKNIKDWNDLTRPGISVITPNPKTSSGGQWNYLAAYGYALKQPGGSPASARAFVTKLYGNVPVLDSGARGATTTFVKRGIGDVLIAWENEAYLSINELGKGQFEIVDPSISILAEPSVAVVDKNVDAHHTRDLATAYLTYLYSPEGQEIAAKHYYRPRLEAVAKKYAASFPKITMFDASTFGDWDTIQKTHFADGGLFDQVYHK